GPALAGGGAQGPGPDAAAPGDDGRVPLLRRAGPEGNRGVARGLGGHAAAGLASRAGMARPRVAARRVIRGLRRSGTPLRSRGDAESIAHTETRRTRSLSGRGALLP